MAEEELATPHRRDDDVTVDNKELRRCALESTKEEVVVSRREELSWPGGCCVPQPLWAATRPAALLTQWGLSRL